MLSWKQKHLAACHQRRTDARRFADVIASGSTRMDSTRTEAGYRPAAELVAAEFLKRALAP